MTSTRALERYRHADAVANGALDPVDRYRHAVAEKSRAEDYWRTAVQHVDAYQAWYAGEYWKQEVRDAYACLPSDVTTE